MPPKRKWTREKGAEFARAFRLEAERYLGPAHHRIAVEELDHVGLGSLRPVVAEHGSRCDHVAAFVKWDRYHLPARRIASVERVGAAATFHPGNADRRP